MKTLMNNSRISQRISQSDICQSRQSWSICREIEYVE